MSEFAQRMSMTSSDPAVVSQAAEPLAVAVVGRPVRDVMIGGTAFRRPALLAPMSGVTDLPFRRLALRFGADVVVTEMVASDALAVGDVDATVRLAGEGVATHVVQIAGREPEATARAAALSVDAGADVIDLNMGCPAKRVCQGWSGSALMRDLDVAVAIIRAVKAAVPVPVTLKMRLGWSPTTINAPELARRAEAEGVELVTVHGRTRDQFYEGRADWSAVAAVRAAISVPLVVNGDIDGAASAQTALAASGADGVMIGRAACGRPWLVGDVGRALRGEPPVAAPEGVLLGDLVAEHYETMLAHHGTKVGLKAARKHLAWYVEAAESASGLTVPEALRRTLLTSLVPADVIGTIRAIFAGAMERRAA